MLITRLLLFSTILALPLASAFARTDLLLGHFEVHIDYQRVTGNPNAGWDFSVSYDEDNDFNDGTGITRLAPADVRLIAAPRSLGTGTAFTASLVPAGSPIWLLPQNNQRGVLFLGVRTVVPAGIFQSSVNGIYRPSPLGNIALRMTSVTGSGPDAGGRFAMWESTSLGGAEFHFNSANGINAADRLDPVPIGSHTHYNWGMTRPGSYQVRFEASGKLNPQWGGQVASASTSFTFVVPFSGAISTGAELRLGGDATLPVSIFSTSENCEYAPDRGALLAMGNPHDGFEHRLNLASDSVAAPNRVGIPENATFALAPAPALAPTPLELVSFVGPGNVMMMYDAGAAKLHFSESGIYRVTLQTAFENGSKGEPFTLVLLAGLPVDYSYAQWADSFERAHGAAAGELADIAADADGDGVPNGIEYQLFWHGLDPLASDSSKMPMPEVSDGRPVLRFLRDTYKDDFGLEESSIALRFSENLGSWSYWHSRAPTKPNGVFENTAEPGDGLGRVMLREVVAPEEATAGFFTWILF